MPHSPTPPSVPAATSSKFSFLITTFAVVMTLILVVLAGCESGSPPPTPSVQDRIAESTIANKDKLRIGVYEDTPLMGFIDANGVRSGFDIDIARGVAEFLGFKESRIDWIPVKTPADRETLLQKGEVDIVVASFSINDDRKKQVRFAGPYLVTTQEVLIHKSLVEEITELGHLRDSTYRVCVAGASTSKKQLQDEGIAVESVSKRQACVDGILSRRFVATSSDQTILAGFLSQHPDELAIVDMPFEGSEELGIAVPHHDKALQDVIGYYLMRNREDAEAGRSTTWQAAYTNNLGHWLGPASQPFPDDVPKLVDHDDRIAR